jgi:hypothetical protein
MKTRYIYNVARESRVPPVDGCVARVRLGDRALVALAVAGLTTHELTTERVVPYLSEEVAGRCRNSAVSTLPRTR